ncbi:ubiquitin C-terminal hydrolase 13-like isoform X2 [Argentina anserina]|uniref:ubiquitin C-terminal hydrolase 13-like isoform X2 n=1 Tax=Argentina anserina TaxID=57926 RepID=UPI0021761D86|nr:ubiquitin C-terminal hydrolase 13-like isoform X2 [Potentilla anserina]
MLSSIKNMVSRNVIPNRWRTSDETSVLNCKANFGNWKTKLESVLKLNHVDYVLTEPKPPEPTTVTPQTGVARHQKWLVDDSLARGLILETLDATVYVSYLHHPTAASLMKALTDYFTQPSMFRRLVKFRRYMEHKFGEGKSVNEHVKEMGSLAAELENEGVQVPEELKVLMLINSLPDRWRETIDGLMVNMDKDGPGEMGLDKVTKRLIDLGLKKHREENPDLYATIKVSREEDLFEQIGKDIFFGLVDHKKIRSFCILKETPFDQFKEEVAKEFGIPVQYQRYWKSDEGKISENRPWRRLTLMEERASVEELTGDISEVDLFLELELGPDGHPIAPPDRTTDVILLFFKLYDPEAEKLRYVGRLFVNLTDKPTEILPKLNKLSGYSLDQEIVLYVELEFKPEVICPLIDMDLTFRDIELLEGDIVCFQKPTAVDNGGRFPNPDFPSFLKSVRQ